MIRSSGEHRWMSRYVVGGGVAVWWVEIKEWMNGELGLEVGE